MEVIQMSSRDALNPPSPDSGQPAERQSLAEYGALVWRFRGWLLLATIAGAAVATAVSLSGPPVYESTVTFEVMQSKVGDTFTASGATPATYLPLVNSLSTASAVIDQLHLDRSYHLRPSDLLNEVMTVEEV